MTKLEELESARDAASDALDAAWDAYDAASAAYWAELRKIQEENSND